MAAPGAAQSTGTPHWVDHYADDFSTDKAQHDAAGGSVFWVDGSAPPNVPHLVFSDQEGQRLVFRQIGATPAELVYGLPIDPAKPMRVVPVSVEVELDVALLGGSTPGYLLYRVSADGAAWSEPVGLTSGHQVIHLGYLSTARFVKFLGSQAAIDNLTIDLYMSPADIYVPQHFVRIQDAVDSAKPGNRIVVSDGLYTGPGNRGIRFKGKAIALVSENGPERCIIDCEYQDRAFCLDSAESRDAVIEGFTIMRGQAPSGGGIYCSGSSPTLSYCRIRLCKAWGTDPCALGGGMACTSGDPLIRFCDFSDNLAQGNGQGARGGGLYLGTGSGIGAVLESCTFLNNRVDDATSVQDMGGGLCTESSPGARAARPTLRNCLIVRNTSGDLGGGMAALGRMPDVINCTLADNIAARQGGGIYLDRTSFPGEAAKLRNCIVWGDSPDAFALEPGAGLDVTYTNVMGTWPGEGNLSGDPLFANPALLDYHVASWAGRWQPSTGAWVRDVSGSPCIDAGAPNDKVGLERSPNGQRVNLGAYGGTAQASRTRGARVIHVDVAGGDQKDGLSRATALATIVRAVSIARTGDTVMIWPGTYTEDVYLLGKAITIQSAADAAVVRAKKAYAFSLYQGESASTVIRNLIITGGTEGAILCHGTSPTLTNLTIVRNAFGLVAFEYAKPHVTNCILWDNTSGDVQGCTVAYSCVQNADQAKGESNLWKDPLFVDPDSGNFRLQSRFGRYWPEQQVWIVDKATSPCIDTGDPASDYSLEPDENGSRINLGAYGGTPYASMSPPEPGCDLNRDGVVDFLDFAVLASYWLKSPSQF